MVFEEHLGTGLKAIWKIGNNNYVCYSDTLSVEVMDIELLSKDDSDIPTHMFRVKVHYKDKDTVLNSGFWPECVGCRHYLYKKKMDTSKKPGEQTNTDNLG